MKFKMKSIAVAGIVALALTSIGGVALAKTSAQTKSTPATSETTTGVDTDNVQEGDQTTPDTGAEAAGEESEAAGETGGESAAESDGPGGHADPAGNVDHQFDGEE